MGEKEQLNEQDNDLVDGEFDGFTMRAYPQTSFTETGKLVPRPVL